MAHAVSGMNSGFPCIYNCLKWLNDGNSLTKLVIQVENC